MKMIHHYAREIDQTPLHNNDDDLHSDNQFDLVNTFGHSSLVEDSQLPPPEVILEGNNQMIRGIQGFYHKIHDEIAQLKTILLED